jgi:hypothetical protein
LIRRSILGIIVVSLIVIVISSYYGYNSSIAQTEETIIVPELSYSQHGDFFCVAQLTPNSLYNTTTLTPQQGVLYQNLVEQINVTFRYEFLISQPSNITVSYNLATKLSSPAGWEKTMMIPIDQNSLSIYGNNATFAYSFTIDPEYYRALQQQINDQIGGAAVDYTLNVQPQINTVVLASNHTIFETFTPTLIFRTQSGNPATYFMDGFIQSSQSTINHTEIVYNKGNSTGMYASYIVSGIAVIVLVGSLFLLFKYRNEKTGLMLNANSGKSRREASIEDAKEINKSSNLIAEVAEKPAEDGVKTVVRMKSFKNLAKVADELFKPILSEELSVILPNGEKQKKFYVLDGPCVYEYIESAWE